MPDTRTCYYPDGTEATGSVPCTPKDTTSCCGVNNICLSNGYCLDVTQPFVLARGSCTSQEWGTGCPGHCRQSPPRHACQLSLNTHKFNSGTVNKDKGSAIVNVNFSNGTSTYCCGTPVVQGGEMVCRDGLDSFQLANAQILPGRAALANLVQADTSSNTSNSSASPTSTPSHSNSRDTTIGVGLGVPLGVIAIGSLIWALGERRRANRLSRAMMVTSFPTQEGLVRSPQSRLTSEGSAPTELDGHRQIPELMPREM
ncbi:uncharacterized protein N7482_002573 [Penicillium canariense]|uniref:Uncharacterized protein n=1 Tax=Penicillium canariense TaxID=189055 RepID=A0A9W9IM09_9EURO|nr:uncharacterized protein N7482_002573 [Penicillium canariense]KAJ5176696.1 hypothetical protein N7482_002573 [Penicillium canariense]